MPLATFPRLCLPDDALPPLLWPPLGVEGAESLYSLYTFTTDPKTVHTFTMDPKSEASVLRESLTDWRVLGTCKVLHGPLS